MIGSSIRETGREAMEFLRGSFVPPRFRKSIETGGKQRIEFIDLAKGVCIMLVMLLHTPKCPFDFPGLAAVRMPLYFILSGLFFKDYGGMVTLLEKKINKILIPFLFFLTIDFAVQSINAHTLDFSFFIGPWSDPLSIKNIPIWFLCALFLSTMIFGFVLDRTRRYPILTAFVSVGLGIAGLLLTRHKIYLPFYLTQALNGLPFFYAGYLIKRTSLLTNKSKFNLIIGVLLIFAVIMLCHAIGSTPHMDFLVSEVYGPETLIHLTALAAVVGLLLVCKEISWLPIISYIGRYSIISLGLHRILILNLRWSHISWLGIRRLDGLMLYLVVVILCWIAIPVCRRVVPYLTAQRDLLSFSGFRRRLRVILP